MLGLRITGMATAMWRWVMNSHALGKTGIQVSELGLGAWQLGERSWNGPGEQESLRIVDEALTLGCTFVDTAPAYGGGRSEALLGQALEGGATGWSSARSSDTDPIVVLTSAPTASRSRSRQACVASAPTTSTSCCSTARPTRPSSTPAHRTTLRSNVSNRRGRSRLRCLPHPGFQRRACASAQHDDPGG